MKIDKFKAANNHPLLLLVFTVLSLTSCESEFDVESADLSAEPPVIHSVSQAADDIPVTQGVLNSTYIIRGENFSSLTEIYFNGVRAFFNPALTKDDLTFVKIPETAPYVGQDNTLRLVNTAGSTEYDFSLLQIEEFTEGTTEDGIKTVTLIGGDFSDTSTVIFTSGSEENGDLVEIPAEILSVSESEVTVAVPPGIEQAFIVLETSRGAAARSESYGFNHAVFVDELNPDWEISQWGGSFDAASTEVALGDYSVKRVGGAWSGLTFTTSGLSTNLYDALTVNLYGTGAPGDKVTIAINNWAGSTQVELIPGEWKKVVIPFSEFFPNGGIPSTITRIDFQEASNTGLAEYTFYVDDFGFL